MPDPVLFFEKTMMNKTKGIDTVNKKVTSNRDKCPEPLNNPEEESGVATLDWAVPDDLLETVKLEDLRTLN